MKDLLAYLAILVIVIITSTISVVDFAKDRIYFVETTAVVIEFDEERSDDIAHIKYEVDGAELNGIVKYQDLELAVGDEIKIFYHKSNPEFIKRTREGIGGIIIAGINLIIIGVWGFFLIKKAKSDVKMIKQAIDMAKKEIKEKYDEYI